MLEDMIVVTVCFIVAVYIAQIVFVIIDLSVGRYGILTKKQIRLLLIPFGFIPILIERYKERGE